MLLIDELLLQNSYFGQTCIKIRYFYRKFSKIAPLLPDFLASGGRGIRPLTPNGLWRQAPTPDPANPHLH